MGAIIRELLPSDKKQWQKCFVALQDFEASIESDRLSATSILADNYWRYINSICQSNSGKIFAADLNGEVVGFVTAWLESDEENLISKLHRFGYVSDIVVLPECQSKGLGRQLMDKAEQYLKSIGIEYIKVGVLAKNFTAHEFYLKLGYHNHEVSLLKKLK